MPGHPDSGSQNLNSVAPPGGAYVSMNCGQLGIGITSLLDASNPIMTSGYGGWQLVTRRKRVSLTDWQGVDPYRLQFGLILDSYALDASTPLKDTIEGDCLILEKMSFADRKQNTRPPKVRIVGPLPHTELTYVVETVTWGDAIRNRDTGKRLRQAVTIGLLELVEDTVLNSLSPAKTMRSAQAGVGSLAFPKTYVVKATDTLGSIAALIYGKQSAWHEIAKANGIRDPASIRVGQTLKIPNPSLNKVDKVPAVPKTTDTSNPNPYGPDPTASFQGSH